MLKGGTLWEHSQNLQQPGHPARGGEVCMQRGNLRMQRKACVAIPTCAIAGCFAPVVHDSINKPYIYANTHLYIY